MSRTYAPITSLVTTDGECPDGYIEVRTISGAELEKRVRELEDSLIDLVTLAYTPADVNAGAPEKVRKAYNLLSGKVLPCDHKYSVDTPPGCGCAKCGEVVAK